jgi:hypothetical protein
LSSIYRRRVLSASQLKDFDPDRMVSQKELKTSQKLLDRSGFCEALRTPNITLDTLASPADDVCHP